MIAQLLSIAGMVLVVAVLSAGTLAPLLLLGAVVIRSSVVLTSAEEWHPRARWWVASCVLAFVSIVLAVWLIGRTGGEDEASHCGPGTRYVSQNHLIGKTVVHDWVCVP